MKNLSKLLLMAMLALLPKLAFAQSSNPDDWSFDKSVQVGDQWYYVDTNNGVAKFSCLEHDTPRPRRLEIASSVKYEGKDYPVVQLSNEWGYKKEGIEEIVVPNGVKCIDREGLAGFPDLKALDIPATVTYLRYGAFRSNASLTSITLRAAKLDFVDSDLFSYHGGDLHVYLPACKQAYSLAERQNVVGGTRDYTPRCVFVHVPKGSINSYRMAQGWTYYVVLVDGDGNKVNITGHKPGALAAEVLKQCPYAAEVNDLTVSGGDFDEEDWKTMKDMVHLLSLDLGGTAIKDIPRDAMREIAYGMTALTLPQGLVSIDEGAFYACGIKNLVIPATVTTIGNAAFYRCYRLESVDVPGSVTTIPKDCFCYNYRIANIILREGIRNMAEYAFQENISLKSIKMPSSLRSIGPRVFEYCYALEQVELNEGLLEMKYDAFRSCEALRSITIPSTVMMMHSNPFPYCDNLVNITCLCLVPPVINIDAELPSSNMAGRTLYVPAPAVNLYKTAETWHRFNNIVGIEQLPANINVMSEHTLELPASIPADYRPAMVIGHVNLSTDYDTWRKNAGQLLLNTQSTLNLSDFQMVQSVRYIDASASTLIATGKDVRAAKGSIDLTLPSERWSFVTFPFDVRVADIAPVNPDHVINFAIMRYDAAKRAANQGKDAWVRVGAGEVLKAGEGYIVNPSYYYYDDWYGYRAGDARLLFPAASSFALPAGDAQVRLASAPAEFDHNAHWNFVGNPYTAYYDLGEIAPAKVVTLWDPSQRNYVSINTADDSYILTPGESFFVQGSAQPTTLTFPAAGRQNYSAAKGSLKAPRRTETASARQLLNLTLSDGTFSDRTRVVINPDASMDYEIGRDAAKFASLDAGVPQIATLCGDAEYAINERPLADGRVLLNVSCQSQTAELSLDADLEGYSLYIYNGVDYVPFGADQPFSFRPADHAQLVLCITDGATGIQTLEQDAAPAPIYSLDGRRASMQTPGVYVVGGRKVIK